VVRASFKLQNLLWMTFQFEFLLQEKCCVSKVHRQ